MKNEKLKIIVYNFLKENYVPKFLILHFELLILAYRNSEMR